MSFRRLNKKQLKVLKSVWENRGAVWRYVPRATNPGNSYAWQVFDRLEQKFVGDPDLLKIEPDERLPEFHQ